MRTDSIENTGLLVARQALDPVLTYRFEKECSLLMQTPLPGSSERKARGRDNPDEITAYSYPVEALGKVGLKAIPDVLRLLGRDLGYHATFNLQKPYAKGLFHDDAQAEAPMFVVQASGNGTFDIAPRAQSELDAEMDHEPIEVGAGDIVIQHDTTLLHRGSNRGESPRYNMVVWRQKPFASLEDVMQEPPIEF
jgi:hypothetical protein